MPSFHGAAPLHHTLLSGERYTGITVQTLHPEYLDRGKILLQTRKPGLQHECQNVEELSRLLAPRGADMLVECLDSRSKLLAGTCSDLDESSDSLDTKAAKARHAPKITSADRFIYWKKYSAKDIILRHKIIGPLWNSIGSDEHGQKGTRVIWNTGFEAINAPPNVSLPIGQPMVIRSHDYSRNVYIRTCDDQVLRINQIKVAGGEQNEPLKAASRARLRSVDGAEGDGPLFKDPILSILPVQHAS